jgi:short-subunit dehydrogenase
MTTDQDVGWRPDDLPDLRGRRVVITGATSGVGRAVATELGTRGVDLVLAARPSARADAVVEDLRATGAPVELVALDLADLGSVASAVR